MRDQLHPGVKRFVVRSASPAGFQLIRPDKGYTKAEAARDVNLGLNGRNMRALKRFERNITFVAGVNTAPGNPGVMWADLTPGRHWAVDVTPRNLKAGKLRTIRVAGEPTKGDVRGDGVIRAVDENAWAKQPGRIPNQGKLTFRNDDANNHFVVMTKLRKGKTLKDVRRFLNGEGPPPVRFQHTLDTGVVSPGEEMTMKYSLPRGRYVVLCFWPDADMGGMPHALMGMIREIRLN
jgi:hypothetical protein